MSELRTMFEGVPRTDRLGTTVFQRVTLSLFLAGTYFRFCLPSYSPFSGLAVICFVPLIFCAFRMSSLYPTNRGKSLKVVNLTRHSGVGTSLFLWHSFLAFFFFFFLFFKIKNTLIYHSINRKGGGRVK